MIQDIYIRPSDDPNFKPNVFEHSNELELLLGKIRLMFNTTKGEVLGDIFFGINLEDELFTFNINNEELRKKIIEHIRTYIVEAKKYNIDIDIQRFRGTLRDIVLIDVLINASKYMGFLVK